MKITKVIDGWVIRVKGYTIRIHKSKKNGRKR